MSSERWQQIGTETWQWRNLWAGKTGTGFGWGKVIKDGEHQLMEEGGGHRDILSAMTSAEQRASHFNVDLLRQVANQATIVRNAQTTYFKDRTKENLIASKQAEKILDYALNKWNTEDVQL